MAWATLELQVCFSFSSNYIVDVVTEYWANFNLPSRDGLGMDNCHDLYLALP
jgi:hypothetical protein